MEFAPIPAGSFMMGCGPGDTDCYPDEYPQHQVVISRPFYMGRYEVTQAQWQAVMDDNPSRFEGADLPVEPVSWNEAQEFVRRLNQLHPPPGGLRYRLPTEAEWEYAARAGTATIYSFGDDAARLGQYAWYEGNAEGRTHPVGRKKPNRWGLYDMHGNVWEWVEDRWSEGYSYGAATDPRGPRSGDGRRVFRGGGWFGKARTSLRSSYRSKGAAGIPARGLGLRLALAP